jgi:hypothetical protein
VVGRIRAKIADARIIGATVTSALGSTNANHGSPARLAKADKPHRPGPSPSRNRRRGG